MSVTVGAVASAIAIAIPLLDAAIKDKNYLKVKRYQAQLNAIIKKYNIKNIELNNLLSKYQQKYSDAVNYIYSTTRNSIDRDMLTRQIEDSRHGIETTQSEIRKYTNESESAQAAVNDQSRKYENKGLVETIGNLIGNGGN